MRKIEILFEGKLIFKSDEDLSKKEIEKRAHKSLIAAEAKANELGNPRLHIFTKEI